MQLGCGREVQARLADVQHKLRAQHPVNHYAVLGVKSSASAAGIKAAYRCAQGGEGACGTGWMAKGA